MMMMAVGKVSVVVVFCLALIQQPSDSKTISYNLFYGRHACGEVR